MRKIALLLLAAGAVAQHYQEPVVKTGYQLTARPWKPLEIPREKYLEVIEGECEPAHDFVVYLA